MDFFEGAEIDAVGGELHSTPLHWATRQGHTQIIVSLMQYGADPAIRFVVPYLACWKDVEKSLNC